MKNYYCDYPTEPIGGGNPYYRCVSCKISDPQINGQLENHAKDCEWVANKRIQLSTEKATKDLLKYEY